MQISIIVPTLNEQSNIEKLISHLLQAIEDSEHEIIVVDGGSSDKTVELVRQKGITCIHSKKGRAIQMNTGAKAAKGNILYFVHADSIPPLSFVDDIKLYLKKGYPMGCYRFKLDSDSLLLKINSYFTRFDKEWCRGGDQTFYIKKDIFEEFGGYCEDHMIMEEYEFMRRARAKYPFKIMPKDTIVSARKYEHNSYLRVQLSNLIVFNMYRLGYSQETLFKTYRKLLKWH